MTFKASNMIHPTFAVIYRSYILPNKEKEYIALWKTIANYFVENRGALGSTLHKAEEGYWVAYSRWPDKKTRDASWLNDGIKEDLPKIIQEAIASLKACANLEKERFSDICMEIIENAP